LAEGTDGLVHDSAVLALLPIVVPDGVLVLPSTSHGVREARLPTTRVQSSAFGLWRQHQFSRVSVLGLFHGSAANAFSGGLAGNTRQRARNGAGAGLLSRPTVPL
jgi:hypothetical protein